MDFNHLAMCTAEAEVEAIVKLEQLLMIAIT